MENKPIILKDKYDVSASKIQFTMPLFDDKGNWVIDYVITEEEWNERTRR